MKHRRNLALPLAMLLVTPAWASDMGGLFLAVILIFGGLGMVCSLIGGLIGLAVRRDRAASPKLWLLMSTLLGGGLGLVGSVWMLDQVSVNAVTSVAIGISGGVGFLLMLSAPSLVTKVAADEPTSEIPAENS